MASGGDQELLRGNFRPKKRVVKREVYEGLTAKFEREALKRLGGSIAFVSKKKFLYGMNQEPAAGDAAQ